MMVREEEEEEDDDDPKLQFVHSIFLSKDLSNSSMVLSNLR